MFATLTMRSVALPYDLQIRSRCDLFLRVISPKPRQVLPQPKVIIARLDLSYHPIHLAFNVLWHHQRPPHKAFTSQKAEIQGFFGANRDPYLIDSCDACIRHALSQVKDDVGIVAASATHEDLVELLGSVPAVVFDQRLGCHTCNGSNTIFRACSLLQHLLANIFAHTATRYLSSRGFREIMDGKRLL